MICVSRNFDTVWADVGGGLADTVVVGVARSEFRKSPLGLARKSRDGVRDGRGLLVDDGVDGPVVDEAQDVGGVNGFAHGWIISLRNVSVVSSFGCKRNFPMVAVR